LLTASHQLEGQKATKIINFVMEPIPTLHAMWWGGIHIRCSTLMSRFNCKLECVYPARASTILPTLNRKTWQDFSTSLLSALSQDF
jgi:hypothetical protein